jgi:hypothetical protein
VPTLEEMLASANGWFFLKEFFFSNTKFAPPGRTELELADGIVLFEDVLIVFQAKAREQPTSDPASEEKWFEKRVSRDAVKQVNDTLAYLRDHDIVLRNDRGDEVALPRGLKGLRIVSLVLYAPGSALPPHLRLRKGRLSTTAGMFVHFLPADGYSRVLSTLFTLPEILDYFGHRCTWALKLGPDADRLYEKALVGHYLAGSDEVPANADARWVDTLVDDTDAFQIVRILQNFRERSLEVMPAEALGTSYYAILGELMKLKRSMLRSWKERFLWAWNACCAEEVGLPTRMKFDTGCGFVMIPLPQGIASQPALQNLTHAAKYELRVDRCVGITFRQDGAYRLLDWMWVDGPWTHDEEMEAALANGSPFRPSRAEAVPTYLFVDP